MHTCVSVCVVLISVLGCGQFLCSNIWCQLGETKEAQGGQFTVRGKSESCFFCTLFKGQNLTTLYLAGLHNLPKKLQIQIFVWTISVLLEALKAHFNLQTANSPLPYFTFFTFTMFFERMKQIKTLL